MNCQRCSIAGVASYRARNGSIDVILCAACAAEARQLGFVIETLATRAAEEVHPPPPTREPGTVDKQNFSRPLGEMDNHQPLAARERNCSIRRFASQADRTAFASGSISSSPSACLCDASGEIARCQIVTASWQLESVVESKRADLDGRQTLDHGL